MSEKENAQNVIDSYRKRQQAAQRAPWIIGIAALLLVVGAGILIFWLLGENRPAIALFASPTPTPTETATPTVTATATATATETSLPTDTATVTLTPTVSGPFTYQVQEGDNLWAIADQFDVDLLTLILLNNLDPVDPTIRTGDLLTIPGPDTQLPTSTPLPTNVARGTRIEYRIQTGDSLLSIALAFNSTVDAIKEENDIANENEIFVGQLITVPVNIVTAVPTGTPEPPTNTPQFGTPINVQPTATETPTPQP